MTNKTTLASGPAEKTWTPRRINIVVAVLMLLFTIVVAAIGGLFLFQGKAANLFSAGLIISVLTAVLLGAVLVVQNCLARYRPPTGAEIGKDLFAALWGIGFAVPLIFVALDGQLTHQEDWFAPAALAVVGILFPAIRPRRTLTDETSTPTTSG